MVALLGRHIRHAWLEDLVGLAYNINKEFCAEEVIRMCTRSQLDKILQAIRKEAVRQFGGQLDAVVLYGSYARGDYDDESDIDVMVCVKLSKSLLAQYRKTFSHLGSDLGLEHDITVSIHLQDQETFEQYKNDLPFYRNVLREGVPVYA